MELKQRLSQKAELFFFHPAISEQVSARQPALWLAALFYISPFWLLSSIYKILYLSFPAFSRACADHTATYRSFYFSLQASIICAILIGCSIRFRAALWGSHVVNRRTKWRSLLIFLPVLCLYSVWTRWRLGVLHRALSSSDVSIYQIHDYYWSGALYGPSLNGVS